MADTYTSSSTQKQKPTQGIALALGLTACLEIKLCPIIVGLIRGNEVRLQSK